MNKRKILGRKSRLEGWKVVGGVALKGIEGIVRKSRLAGKEDSR